MMVPNSSDTPLKSIANYQNFGLREIWVELYSSMRENFPDTVADGTLGAPMVDSARIWFKQALLTRDSRTLEPGRLLDVAAQMGIDNDMLWCLIWIALVNNAPLLKWFAATLQFDKQYSIDDISNKLGDIVSASTKKGGLQALYNMFKSCPIGMGSDPIVQVTQKGVRVLGLKRVSKSVSPLVILYSLYLMADIADRTSFTLSEMMSGDFDSPFISPLVAFGMSIEELKGQCMGISSIYPQFISCSFALGLDEVKIFPKEKSLDDVISLILGE